MDVYFMNLARLFIWLIWRKFWILTCIYSSVYIGPLLHEFFTSTLRLTVSVRIYAQRLLLTYTATAYILNWLVHLLAVAPSGLQLDDERLLLRREVTTAHAARTPGRRPPETLPPAALPPALQNSDFRPTHDAGYCFCSPLITKVVVARACVPGTRRVGLGCCTRRRRWGRQGAPCRREAFPRAICQTILLSLLYQGQ